MDLLSLVARLTLDSSEYDKGLKGAVSNAGKIAGTIGKAASVAIGAATTAVTGFAAASVGVGANFDAAMSQVAAVSGATGKDFDDLRDKAQEMGAKTKFSASEAADAFNYMAMAGWKTGDMLDGIEGVMNLAAASGENLGTTSDIVTDALTAFGLKARDSGHFADILAAASSNANTNVSLMGETFKYAAPVAGAFGFSAEDTAEAIGLMANSGIKASQAGTSLRVIMSKMSGPIKISGKAIGDMEIKTTKADGTMRELNDILDDCRAAFKKLTPAERAAAAESIAGKNAMSGFLALMNSGEDDIHKLRKAIEDCDGATEKMANTMQDNLAGDITIFKSALEGAQIVLSDQLTPTLREFVSYGTTAISTLSTAFQEGGLSGAMEALGPVLSDGLALVISKLPEMVDAGMQLLGALGTGIINNLPQLTQAAVQIVTTVLTQVLSALPQLIPAGVQIIATLASGLSEALPTLIPAAVQAIGEFAAACTDPGSLETLAQSALTILQSLGQGIINSIPELAASAQQIVENFETYVSENLPTLLDTAVEIVQQLVDGLTQNLPTLLEQAPVIIESLLTSFLEAIPQLLEAATEIITTLIQGITENLPTLIEKIPEIITTIVTTLAEHLPEILTAGFNLILELVAGILQGIPKIGEALKNVVDQIGDELKKLPEMAKKWGEDLMQSFSDGISSRVKAVKDSITGVGRWIKDHLGFSEPKEGPLSDFHTYAPDMMELFASGVRNNADMLRREIDRAFDFGENLALGAPQAPAARPMQAPAWGVAGGTREVEVPRGTREPKMMQVILQIRDTEIGRVLVPILDAEVQRMGVKLVTGVR